MNNCWKRDPRERIDFKQILMIVRAMKYDDRFGEECQTFLEKKEAWKPEILNQLRQLKVFVYEKRLRKDFTRFCRKR